MRARYTPRAELLRSRVRVALSGGARCRRWRRGGRRRWRRRRRGGWWRGPRRATRPATVGVLESTCGTLLARRITGLTAVPGGDRWGWRRGRRCALGHSTSNKTDGKCFDDGVKAQSVLAATKYSPTAPLQRQDGSPHLQHGVAGPPCTPGHISPFCQANHTSVILRRADARAVVQKTEIKVRTLGSQHTSLHGHLLGGHAGHDWQVPPSSTSGKSNGGNGDDWTPLQASSTSTCKHSSDTATGGRISSSVQRIPGLYFMNATTPSRSCRARASLV